MKLSVFGIVNHVELPKQKEVGEYAGIKLITDSTIPENEIWVIDAKNQITRIVNIKEKGR